AREPVRLVLGPEPLSIAGRIVDAADQPKSGWIVALVDGTNFTEGLIPPESAEAAMGGGNASAETDDHGAFVLRGLLDREYRLQAFSSHEMLKIESGPIAAGTHDARLVVPADARVPRISGRVLARDG